MKSKKAKPNYVALWNNALSESEKSGNVKLRAVLMNHIQKKEYICTKLGIMSNTDIARLFKPK